MSTTIWLDNIKDVYPLFAPYTSTSHAIYT